MKVICVNNKSGNDEFIYITIGKLYNVSDSTTGLGGLCEIIDDNGELCLYPKSAFVPLSEVREEKLNSIGIK